MDFRLFRTMTLKRAEGHGKVLSSLLIPSQATIIWHAYYHQIFFFQLKSFHNELLTELEKKVELDARYLNVSLWP